MRGGEAGDEREEADADGAQAPARGREEESETGAAQEHRLAEQRRAGSVKDRSRGKQQRTWTPLVAELRRARDCVVKNAVYVWLRLGPDGATRLTRAVALAGALAPMPEMSQGLVARSRGLSVGQCATVSVPPLRV